MTESKRLLWQKAVIGYLGKLQFLIHRAINFHKYFMDASLHTLRDESKPLCPEFILAAQMFLSKLGFEFLTGKL